jgi:hypothetical protein
VSPPTTGHQHTTSLTVGNHKATTPWTCTAITALKTPACDKATLHLWASLYNTAAHVMHTTAQIFRMAQPKNQ